MARSTRRQKLQRCLAGLYHDERNRETGRWMGGARGEEGGGGRGRGGVSCTLESPRTCPERSIKYPTTAKWLSTNLPLKSGNRGRAGKKETTAISGSSWNERSTCNEANGIKYLHAHNIMLEG